MLEILLHEDQDDKSGKRRRADVVERALCVVAPRVVLVNDSCVNCGLISGMWEDD